MKCVRCGKELTAGSRFCTNCGALVAESGNPEAAAPSQAPSGNWPAPAVPSPSENHSPDGGTAGAPAAPEAPGKQAAPSYSQNNPEAVRPVYPPNHNGATPPVSPNQPYYPQPGSPQGPMPPKTSNKLVLGLVLGLVALIVILIVVFAVVLNNNKTPEPSTSSDTASSSVSSEAPDSDSSALPVETENYTVGDVIFTIPVEWGPAFDDNGNLFMTPSADEFMVVYCFAGEADSFSYESYLESLAEDYSNYQHISFGEASFGGISGKLHTYNATLDLDYKISSFYFTIGDDLMCVQYMRSVALPDSREPMEDVLGTLRTAGNADTESATSPSSGSSSAPVQESYSDGIYAVGTDIPAGEYLLLPDAGFNASYEVKAAPDQNGIDSVIDSGTFRARWYLTVEEGQYLTLSSCTMVPAGQAPEVDLSSGVLAEGMYLVGVDIPAGEYTLRSTHDYLGVFEVRSSSRVTDKDSTVIASGNFDDEAYVTVEDGQYLYVRGAEIELPQ